MKLDLGTRERVIIILTFVNLLILVPMLAVPLYYNNDTAATVIYTVYGPTCHQYIERSICFFISKQGSWSMGDCIEDNQHPNVKTLFTITNTNYSGPFFYNKGDVGINRAEVVYSENNIGYKMPACARDFGIYFGAFIGIVLFTFIGKKFGVVSLPIYILFLVPLVVDGVSQMLFSYESENSTRIITGLIAGGASTIALLSMMFNKE